MEGIRPEILVTLDIVPEVFDRVGHYCFVTSAMRPASVGSFHSHGLALDFDADLHIDDTVGKELASMAAKRLGTDYTCIWHDGHLHVEYDKGRAGLQAYLKRRGRVPLVTASVPTGGPPPPPPVDPPPVMRGDH